MEIEISIIVAVYNVEKYLKTCLDSVINQTYRNFECIIVDDGSTDLSGKICEKYSQKDKRFRIIHQKNQGLGAARNAGLDIAIGKYICFLDSDDYLEIDYLEKLYCLMQKGQYDFVSCVANFVDEQGNYIRRNEYLQEQKEVYGNNEIFECYYHSNYIEDAMWNKLYARVLFNDIRFKEGVIYEDTECIVRILKKCNRILFTNLFLYNYRIRRGSILEYQGNDINQKSFSMKKLDLLKVLESCAMEMKGTKWEQKYYNRILYTCSDYAIMVNESENSDKDEIWNCINSYYMRYKNNLRKRSEFPIKEAVAIKLSCQYPHVYKWIMRSKKRKK